MLEHNMTTTSSMIQTSISSAFSGASQGESRLSPNCTWRWTRRATLCLQCRCKMSGHTEIPEDEDILCLVQQGHWHTTDLLSPSQAPTKIKAQAQQKVNNSQHHGYHMHPKQEDHLRLYFQNVNGTNTEEDIKSHLDAMHAREVDTWVWSETNVKWTPKRISKAKYLGNKCFNNFTLIASLSDDPAEYKQQ
eukprot:11139758-Ditylum_brightwellii.AAC.1